MHISHFHQAGARPSPLQRGGGAVARGKHCLRFQRFRLKSTDLLELEVCLSLAHPPLPPVCPRHCGKSVSVLVCLCACACVCACVHRFVRAHAFESSIVGTGATRAATPVLINAAFGEPIANAA